MIGAHPEGFNRDRTPGRLKRNVERVKAGSGGPDKSDKSGGSDGERENENR